MKERTKGFLTGVLAAALTLGLATTAAASVRQITAKLDYNDIKITLDGQTVEPKDANGNTVEPFAIDGTTYLPVRGIASSMGLEVGWDQATSTVTLTTPEDAKTVYITRTGEKYHYDSNCNGGTYWAVPYSTAVGMGLEPCAKCVLN